MATLGADLLVEIRCSAGILANLLVLDEFRKGNRLRYFAPWGNSVICRTIQRDTDQYENIAPTLAPPSKSPSMRHFTPNIFMFII